MKKIYDLVRTAKTIHKNFLTVMVGNIANHQTIIDCMEAGVDYVRVGVGSGEVCITSTNTSIHTPMASLISETRFIRDEHYTSSFGRVTKTKIIADGGIRGYGDVIKALALGADYVMIGGLFSGCLEAEGKFNIVPVDETFDDPNIVEYRNGHFYYSNPEKGTYPIELKRKFYGMASKDGQRDISGDCVKTSEGISKTIPITITLDGWSKNMIDYLRSAMSYCDCRNLEQIYDRMICNIVSPFSTTSINK